MDITYSFRHSLSVCIRLMSCDVVDGCLQIHYVVLILITCGTQVYLHVGFMDLLPTMSLYDKNTCTNRPETWSVGHIGHEKAHGEARCGL